MVTESYFNRYLDNIGSREDGLFANPMVDGLLASEGQNNYDPFLLAQDIPQDFSVDPSVDALSAVVHLQYGPNCVRHLQIMLNGKMQILSVTEDSGRSTGTPIGHANLNDRTRDWQTFAGAEFYFAYPPAWQVTELEPAAGGLIDWPVTATWLVMPEAIADTVLAGGTPNPTAPVVVAPFNVEWV